MSDETQSNESNQKGAKETPSPPGALEKLATGFSALLVICLLGILVWDATHPDSPPAFEVSADSMSMHGGSYRVPVQVRNTGDESAKSVIVHVELTQSDTAISETDITVDWLPGRSKRDAVALFKAEGKAPDAVRAEVRGYAVP